MRGDGVVYSASAEYKKEMRQKYRDGLNLLRVTIGVVNQEAQASASVLESGNYAYYSDLKRPLDNYKVEVRYVTRTIHLQTELYISFQENGRT